MRALFAEALGTFILVFAGTGAIVINDTSGGIIGHIGIAFTFGLIVTSIIYALGHISGAHVNPAVTIAFWIAKRFPGRQVLPYIGAQFTGALTASLLLSVLFADHAMLGTTLPKAGIWQSFVLELVLSWWLMQVILSVSEGAQEKGILAGIVVGAVVALEATFAGPASGASMNPARSFAPALLSDNLDAIWIYLTAPFIGMMIAVASCRLLGNKCCCAARPLDKTCAL